MFMNKLSLLSLVLVCALPACCMRKRGCDNRDNRDMKHERHHKNHKDMDHDMDHKEMSKKSHKGKSHKDTTSTRKESQTRDGHMRKTTDVYKKTVKTENNY